MTEEERVAVEAPEWGTDEEMQVDLIDLQYAESCDRLDLYRIQKDLNWYKKVKSPNLDFFRSEFAKALTKNINEEKINHESRGASWDFRAQEWAFTLLNQCRILTLDEQKTLEILKKKKAILAKTERDFYNKGMSVVRTVDKSQWRLAGIVLRMELNEKHEKGNRIAKKYQFSNVSELYFRYFLFRYNNNKDDSKLRTCQHWFQPIESKIRKPNGNILDIEKSYSPRQMKICKQTDSARSMKRKKVDSPPLEEIDDSALQRLVSRIRSEIAKKGLRQQWKVLSPKTANHRNVAEAARKGAVKARQEGEELALSSVSGL